jgi:hypothetical protein
VSRPELRRDVLIMACAVSAGIHGALAPAHFAEGTGAGLGFVAATALLAVVGLLLTLRPGSRPALLGTAAVLGGLLAAYGLAVTTGVPLLHPEVEPVDALAVFTKAVEAAGLAAALSLLRSAAPALVPTPPNPKGTLT